MFFSLLNFGRYWPIVFLSFKIKFYLKKKHPKAKQKNRENLREIDRPFLVLGRQYFAPSRRPLIRFSPWKINNRTHTHTHTHTKRPPFSFFFIFLVPTNKVFGHRNTARSTIRRRKKRRKKMGKEREREKEKEARVLKRRSEKWNPLSVSLSPSVVLTPRTFLFFCFLELPKLEANPFAWPVPKGNLKRKRRWFHSITKKKPRKFNQNVFP